MRHYKLQIELSFQTQAEAESLMSTCESLVKGISIDREKELVDALELQITEALSRKDELINDALSRRVEITKLLDEANSTTSGMHQKQREAEIAIGNLKLELSNLTNEAINRGQDTERIIKSAEKEVENISVKLKELDKSIREAQDCAEAAVFIRDMLRVDMKIVTGGNVVMFGDVEKEGQFDVIKQWAV